MASYSNPEKLERLRMRLHNEGVEQCAAALAKIALTGTVDKQYASPVVQDAVAHILNLHETIRTLTERVEYLTGQEWLRPRRKHRKKELIVPTPGIGSGLLT